MRGPTPPHMKHWITYLTVANSRSQSSQALMDEVASQHFLHAIACCECSAWTLPVSRARDPSRRTDRVRAWRLRDAFGLRGPREICREQTPTPAGTDPVLKETSHVPDVSPTAPRDPPAKASKGWSRADGRVLGAAHRACRVTVPPVPDTERCAHTDIKSALHARNVTHATSRTRVRAKV